MTTSRFALRTLSALLISTCLLPSAFAEAPGRPAHPSDDYGLNSLSGTYLAARSADVDKDIPSAAAFYQSALAADPENLLLLERTLVLTAAAGQI
jgi:hypothetical protein